MARVVLVGIDFSEMAGAALDEAAEMSRRFGIPLHVVHVVEGYDRWHDSARAEAQAWLTRRGYADEKLVIRSGVPWVELIREAVVAGARMIVVGSHGTGGFQPLSTGETASRLMVRSPYPVLVVGHRSEAPAA